VKTKPINLLRALAKQCDNVGVGTLANNLSRAGFWGRCSIPTGAPVSFPGAVLLFF
jgi:hypothetical protein